jgi:hypothetical protein
MSDKPANNEMEKSSEIQVDFAVWWEQQVEWKNIGMQTHKVIAEIAWNYQQEIIDRQAEQIKAKDRLLRAALCPNMMNGCKGRSIYDPYGRVVQCQVNGATNVSKP